MPRATEKAAQGYNGPNREKFLDTLAEYEEHRFDVMRATSLAGKVMAEWERWGGDKQDLRDGFALRKMTPEEQKTELQRQYRVAGWLGIVDVDAAGQRSFLKVFEQPAPMEGSGIGNAPLGSKLSLVRAKSAGYNDGRAKAGPTMQEGLEVYANNLGWEADSEEALAYAGGFGEGLKLRPPPKVGKSDAEEEAGEEQEAPTDERVVSLPRGRRSRKSAVETLAERAEAMDNGGRGPSALTQEVAAELDQANESTKPGWQGDRDVFIETTPDPVN